MQRIALQLLLLLTVSSNPTFALFLSTSLGRSYSMVKGDDEADLKFLKDWLSHDSSFHNLSSEEAKGIRDSLLRWYRTHRRKLPWRGDAPPWDGSTSGFAAKSSKSKKLTDFFEKDGTAAKSKESEEMAFPLSAYGVWVSEIMLQQTRVEAVVPYWIRWMKSFPTVQHLANASDEEVNAHWAGLGFYRRARLLHAAAKEVATNGGKIPDTVPELMELSGIGRYTASAIASIAYNVSVPVVDGNVCRVLTRLRGICQSIKAKSLLDEYAWELAQEIVDEENPGDLNQAMMELGATFCAPSGTGVDVNDPLREYYWSTRLGRAVAKAKSQGVLESLLQNITSHNCQICCPEGPIEVCKRISSSLEDQKDPEVSGHQAFPLPPPKLGKRQEVLAVAVISCNLQDSDHFLLVQRPPKGLLAGQWEFPAACVWKTAGHAEDHEVPKPTAKIRKTEIKTILDEMGRNSEGESLYPLKSIQMYRVNTEEPLVHIFSHIRHSMWIERGEFEGRLEKKEWKLPTGQSARWMDESDMDKVGVTSGVKKILKSVNQMRLTSGKKRKRSK